MFQKFLNAQTKSISFASLILAGSYVASASLGVLRDHFIAGRIGSDQADAYYAAFAIPDFVALLLIFGAISAAIIPIFSSYFVKSKEDAWIYTANLFNIFLGALMVVCVALIIFAPSFVKLIAPGFSAAKQADTIMLMRVMLLSPIILGASSIVSGILQVFHRFFVTALAPIMYNVGIIIGVVFFVPVMGLIGLAFGVVLGGSLHLLIQLPVFFHSGFRYKFIANIRHPGIVKTLNLMAPRSLGLAAGQMNTIVNTAIASTIAAGSVAIFAWANNLSSLLVNAVAVSISTAVFPALSLAYSRQDKKDFENKFSGAIRQILFLTIPASVLIFVLRAQITRIVWGSGKFGWLDTRLTAACLGVFATGLCFQGLIFILSKTFYAAHNTKIPAIISAATVAFNILLSSWFVYLLGAHGMLYNFLQAWLKLAGIENISVVGLALSYTITVSVESLVLLWLVYKKLQAFRARHLVGSLFKILVSSLALLAVALFVRQELVAFGFVDLRTTIGVFVQFMLSASAGIIVYIVVSAAMKSAEFAMIKNSFFSKI